MKKTLILDEKTWRCGSESSKRNNKRGKGNTQLENPQGFMCCLGQFSKQLKKDVMVTNLSEPRETEIVIPLLTKNKYGTVINTKLSDAAMEINDDEYITVEEKVGLLKRLFGKRGVKITFKRKK